MDEINRFGGSATGVAGDILDAEYLDSVVKKAASFGGGKIHIIVNNAGYTWDAVIHKVRGRKRGDPSGIVILCSGNIRLTGWVYDFEDDRQTMGHYYRAPQHCSLQTHSRGCTILQG